MGNPGHLIATIALALFVGACARLPAPTVPSGAEIKPPAGFPQQQYLQAAERGEAVYRIEPTASEALIYCYRTRLGHNHVVASHTVTGFARLTRDAAIGQADLYVALDSLTVDEAPLRAQAGFDTQLSESDIAGTHSHMLVKVLETKQFPYVTLHVARLETNVNGQVLVVALNLHGVTQTLRVPVQLRYDERELRVSGKFSLRQTDFGITPFSVLGGLFQVQDEVDLQFRVLARRLT
jgi:polyisoprenoid-binding protein YceI